MPTFDPLPRFLREYGVLTAEERDRFRVARRKFVADLQAGQGFRPGLRVKRVEGAEDVFEMTWAPDGRAFFRYGDEVRPGVPHIIWLRIGSHDIFDQQ